MDTIKLRGHHIRELFKHYTTVVQYLSTGKIDELALRLNEFVHTPLFSRYVASKLSQIAFEKDIPVEIVGGLDSLCLGGCPHLQENGEKLCLSPDLARQDKEELEKYGLKPGEPYLSQQLMERLCRTNGKRFLRI